MTGDVISHYKILEKLGEGGMGVVYKAEDAKLKRTVALKFLPIELTRDPEAKERFIHEAQAASALNHPNICSIHAIEEFEGQQLLDMEFLDGNTLGAVLGQKELPISRVMEIVIQVAEGLNAAHKKGVVHRDIKPDNIMLTNDGLVKIMDFGLAKLKGSSKLTKSHSTLGTIAYMSPEQARGEDVDQRTDIFSLGAVLYEMITGRRPFKGEHEAAMMYSLLNEIPEPLARYKTNIPNELQRIIDKALSKKPSERYQHADEIIADLQRVRRETSNIAASTTKKSKIHWIVTLMIVVLTVVGVYFFYPKLASTPANRKSIAVLPFKNLSSSKEDEYFSDGIAEDIRTQLSNIADLKVISQQGVLRYKNSDKSITEIGNELGVATVLEGSVQHAGNQVRINAQLIDASDESHIWADKYDKEMTQIFSIQSEVAQKIAEMLRAKLLPTEKARIEKKPTNNTEAYQLYLKGRFHWNKRTLANNKTAIEYFTQAIEKDSQYALAYAGLASTYVLLPEYAVPSKEALPKADATARKALELDPTLAEPHTVMGLIKTYEWDWSDAEAEFKKAIELDPNSPTAHQWYSNYLSFLGRSEEALAEIKCAQGLDPLSLIINLCVGRILFEMGQFDRAIDQYKKILDLDPSFQWAYLYLGIVYEHQGEFDQAITAFKRAITLAGGDLEVLADLGHAYAKAGRKSDALEVLAKLLRYSKQGNSVSCEIALVYNGLGDKRNTFQWLERALQERNNGCVSLKVGPVWNNLRSDPRFFALLKKMGLEK